MDSQLGLSLLTAVGVLMVISSSRIKYNLLEHWVYSIGVALTFFCLGFLACGLV